MQNPIVLILVVLLILILIGSLPQYSSMNWGYWPSSVVGTVLVILLVLLLLGRL